MSINQSPFNKNRNIMANPLKKPVTPPVKPSNDIKENVLTDTTEEETLTGLLKMQTILAYAGYKTALLPVNEENPIELLFVSLNMDEEIENDSEETPFIQIMFVNDLINASNDKKITDSDDTNLVQFAIPLLNINIPEEKYMDIHALLSVFSVMVPFGYFTFRPDQGIYFRHSFITTEREVNDVILVETVNMINYFMKILIDKIIVFSLTDISLDEIIELTEMALLENSKS